MKVFVTAEPTGTNFGFYGLIIDAAGRCLWSTAQLNDPYPFAEAAVHAAEMKALGFGYDVAAILH